MSQVWSETKACISLLNYVMLTNMQRSVSDYVVVIEELKDNLLFESKLADSEQELDIIEGDAYKSIKEAWLASISTEAFGVNSRVKEEIEVRKAEENNQQLEKNG